MHFNKFDINSLSLDNDYHVSKITTIKAIHVQALYRIRQVSAHALSA